jgi:hypothetical protein
MTDSLEPCPFLEEITEVYCEGAPRKKLPLARLSDGSPCTGEGWRECPVYRALQAKERGEAPGPGSEEPQGRP